MPSQTRGRAEVGLHSEASAVASAAHCTDDETRSLLTLDEESDGPSDVSRGRILKL